MFNKLSNYFINIFKFSTFNKNYKKRAIISFILIISTFTGTFTAYAKSVHDIRIVVDGYWKSFKSSDISVSQLLQKNNIQLNKKDKIDTPLDFVINDDIHIFIETAKNIFFKLDDGKTIPFLSDDSTVGQALNSYYKETGKIFKLVEGQSPAKEIYRDMTINVIPVTEKTVTDVLQIPFKTDIIENPNLEKGTEIVKVEGVLGAKEIKTKQYFINNTLEKSLNVSEKVIKQPINKVIEKGTKITQNFVKTELGNLKYKKKITMKSTAYTAGPESTGKRPGQPGYGITASGMKARKGVVAVDRSLIPFGTKLYIEGYGMAIAADTGGAIKGNKIDVFMNSYNDAINWGVRNVNVYFLD